MTEKSRGESRDGMSETTQILERLQLVAFDHEQDDIDEKLSILSKKAFQASENFREGVKKLIVAMIERDWYYKAEKFASSCGMSDSEYSQLEKLSQPNPRWIA